MRSRALVVALAGVTLAGCTLIDQRTFNPEAGKRPGSPPPAVAAAAPEPGPRPLFTVRPPIVAAAIRADIAKAVDAARTVKPGVVFEVVELTTDPGAGVGAGAAEVARLIIAQRIPATRVHLAARPVAAGAGEVRVYVR